MDSAKSRAEHRGSQRKVPLFPGPEASGEGKEDRGCLCDEKGEKSRKSVLTLERVGGP